MQLSPARNGQWTETVLHSFTGGDDGGYPNGGLILDSVGNPYGTAFTGGSDPMGCNDVGCGTVFELSPQSGGGWSFQVIYNFTDGNDGGNPNAPLVLDRAGNLYGTTAGGNVFELMPQSGGGWSISVLYLLDGIDPYGGLTFDKAGNLYGTTNLGGSANLGTVFRLKPGANGKWTEHSYSFSPARAARSRILMWSLTERAISMAPPKLAAAAMRAAITPSPGVAWCFS